MTLHHRLHGLERRAASTRPPAAKTVREMTDWELASLVAVNTGLTANEVLALSDDDLLALATREDGGGPEQP